MKNQLTVSFNRTDGTERAVFDNIPDAILFGEKLLVKGKHNKKVDANHELCDCGNIKYRGSEKCKECFEKERKK